MNADEAIFELDGPLGIAQLYRDELGYLLFFEDKTSYKSEKVFAYAFRQRAIEDAFEDAKNIVGLEDLKFKWSDTIDIFPPNLEKKIGDGAAS